MFGRCFSTSGPFRLLGVIILLALAASLALPSSALATGNSWAATGSLASARYLHTATLLPNGKVLAVGGYGLPLHNAELYDPMAGAWSPADNSYGWRYAHTATLLPNGKVLVVGGEGGGQLCLLFDPVTQTWSETGALKQARNSHTATILPTGKVLVAGGIDHGGLPLTSTELYDPATGTWTASGDPGGPSPMATSRYAHTATLLPDGQVLVAGGWGAYSSAEIYNWADNSWSTVASLNQGRHYHSATLLPSGKVLVAAGVDAGGTVLNSAELFDPSVHTWTMSGQPGGPPALNAARYSHTATLLPNGGVLVTGGYDLNYQPLSSAETYSLTGNWNYTTGSLSTGRTAHTATLLADGRVLAIGGQGAGSASLASCDVYDYTAGTWTGTGILGQSRAYYTVTLLPNGKVLVAGGMNSSGNPMPGAELFNPGTGTWTGAGSLATPRYFHTGTLLANGRVMVVGGWGGSNVLASCELLDPAANGGVGAWTPSGSLHAGRESQTATLLANGKVLVAGGENSSTTLTSAELFDPAANGGVGAWSTTGSLNAERRDHTATLLPNGKVLVAGGYKYNFGVLASAELFDPAANGGAGAWTAIGSMTTPRIYHTATLLPNGKVLVAGGYGSSYLSSAELFDPAANGGVGAWTTTGSLNAVRGSHTATLLPNSKVLVAGGHGSSDLSSAEIFDPAANGGAGAWTTTGSMSGPRQQHRATLLPNGQVLVAGGYFISTCELYDPGLGFQAAWRPQVSVNSGTLVPGSQLFLTGSQLRGISGASGGATNDSPTNYPLVQLLRLDNERLLWAAPDATNPEAFSDTSFRSGFFQNVQTGHCLVTVFANGIPSVSQFSVFGNTGAPTAVTLQSFTATGVTDYVQVNWQTGAELNTAAFRLWRREGAKGDFAPSQALIPAKGSPTRGAKYSYKDTQVVIGRTYYYQLEDIAANGAGAFHGPISATVSLLPGQADRVKSTDGPAGLLYRPKTAGQPRQSADRLYPRR